MIVLKLGGSVITEKANPETLDGPALDRAADAVAGVLDGNSAPLEGTAKGGGGNEDRDDDLVLVHGAGSFGHHHASEHGVTPTTGTRDVAAVTAIHGSMTTLNRFVLSRLHARDVPGVAVHPLSAGHRDGDGALSLPTGQVETLVEEGFVPVLHGDLLAHAGSGATVLSGDEVVVEVARALSADSVGLCSTVPGVLDADDRVIDRIEAFEDVTPALGGSEATDVTGGMAGKVRRLLALDAPASIFDLDDLPAFLAGDDPGTTIE